MRAARKALAIDSPGFATHVRPGILYDRSFDGSLDVR
jgi:hypothetical protein